MQRSITELKSHPLNATIYGNNDTLPPDFIQSIADFGILTPLLILPDGTILSGHRRWRAARELGLAAVPVEISELTDPLDIEQAIIESNRQREKTFSQKMREAEAIERIERERARQRQGTRTDLVDIVQSFARCSGKTRDKVAEQINIGSGEQYRKAKKVWEAAQAGDTVAQEMIESLDTGDTTIHAALRAIQRERQRAEAHDTLANFLDFGKRDTGKYRAIVIDPPWPVQKILRDVRPNQDVFDYPTMTIEEIAKLPIADLAHPDGCHIYLWFTHKHAPDAFRLFEIWGVKYECIMTWCKNVGFTPFSWMYSTEHVLFGRIGSLAVQRKGLRLDFAGKVREHSRKPDEFYARVIQASPEPRIDLFSREQRQGFEQWGQEIAKFTK